MVVPNGGVHSSDVRNVGTKALQRLNNLVPPVS